MPKFLEGKLKRQYGAKSKIPYKVMNAMGAMKGSKTTAKGRRMQAKHERSHVHTKRGKDTESHYYE